MTGNISLGRAPSGARRLTFTQIKWWTGGPLLAWQMLFFGGALVTLIVMSTWTVVNYKLKVDFNFDSWIAIVRSPLFWRAYANSLLLASLAGFIGTLAALPIAFVVALNMSRRTQRLIMLILILPYFTSYLVRSYAWRFALEQEGLINYILTALGLSPIAFPGTLAAVIIGYLANFLPLVTAILVLGIAALDKTLIEAAHNLGASRHRAFVTVILPLSKAPIIMGFAFGFMLAFGDYVAPAYLGDGLWPTLPTQIVDAIQGRSNFPQAAVIGIITMATLLIALFALLILAFRNRVSEQQL